MRTTSNCYFCGAHAALGETRKLNGEEIFTHVVCWILYCQDPFHPILRQSGKYKVSPGHRKGSNDLIALRKKGLL